MSMAGNLRKVTGLGRVGGLRKVARLARRRPRVDLSHHARSPLGTSVVNCVTYREGTRIPVEGDLVDTVERMRKSRDGFVWLGLHEPSDHEFEGVADLFDLHPLAVEDAVEAHQRPKVERYGETLFAVFKTVCYVEHEELTATSEVVNTGEIMVFVGEDFVITVRHGSHGSLGPLREELEADPAQLAKGAYRGAARDRGPCGRRLSERHRLGAVGHRPGRDGGVLGERRPGGPGPHLPAQA